MKSLVAKFFTLNDLHLCPRFYFSQQKKTKLYQLKEEVCFDVLSIRGGVQYTCNGEVWGLLSLGLMVNLSLMSLPSPV